MSSPSPPGVRAPGDGRAIDAPPVPPAGAPEDPAADVAAAERPAPPLAIELRGITRVFGVTPGVVRVDLTVRAGEVILLRGANGAGKSTLLRIVATLLAPTYGSGRVLGFDLLGERDLIRRRTELLGHRTRLYEDLSGLENLRFACRMHGVDAGRVPEALRVAGLAGAARERVRGYSQGMRQRVAVARAWLRDPALLLLDEPYAGLDAEARRVVDDLVERSRSRGATVVLATHEPAPGIRPSRTLVMEAGRVAHVVGGGV